MDCDPPGSSVHRISQARMLELAAISSPGDLPSRGSNVCLLHWQVDSSLQSHLGSPFTILPSYISAWGVDGRPREQVDELVHE